jgi:hypothetical protein
MGSGAGTGVSTHVFLLSHLLIGLVVWGITFPGPLACHQGSRRRNWLRHRQAGARCTEGDRDGIDARHTASASNTDSPGCTGQTPAGSPLQPLASWEAQSRTYAPLFLRGRQRLGPGPGPSPRPFLTPVPSGATAVWTRLLLLPLHSLSLLP